ncbi:hypothetical protein OsI_35266 [Oryza sativa Indica Group]|uniref:Uncharacterized protein n=1 Tax=Oryza sativa subsp. indica TaxID=39946 RepID=B8BJB3_ORYSI|nr:hypothetical protein OsI_35266 [Oryza sativa Indica Group]
MADPPSSSSSSCCCCFVFSSNDRFYAPPHLRRLLRQQQQMQGQPPSSPSPATHKEVEDGRVEAGVSPSKPSVSAPPAEVVTAPVMSAHREI